MIITVAGKMDRNIFCYFLVNITFCVAYGLSKMNVTSIATFRITKFHMCPTPNSKFHTISGISLEKCVQECIHRARCKAVGFKRLFQLCELHVQVTTQAVTDKHCVMILLEDMDDRPSLSKCDKMSSLDVEPNECIRKECPLIQPLDNVTSIGNMNTVNARKMVQCQSGFFEVSNRNHQKTVRCTQHGYWSIFPQCKECPKDGEDVRGLQFFRNEKEHQEGAYAFCSAQHASLVRIKDHETFKYIRSVINRCMQNDEFWMDGQKHNGIWKYSNNDSVPINDSYWNREQYGNKTCLRMVYRFLDKSCTKRLGFICELL